jgi:hypothetical protein
MNHFNFLIFELAASLPTELQVLENRITWLGMLVENRIDHCIRCKATGTGMGVLVPETKEQECWPKTKPGSTHVLVHGACNLCLDLYSEEINRNLIAAMHSFHQHLH